MEQQISSPRATGGAGTFFEQHVAGYWLAQLLVRAIPPILIDTNTIEVSFQTERLGWHTDDFLVTCQRSDGTQRKLAGQAKLNFTLSAANDECKKTVLDFWKDYGSADRFSAKIDRLVLVVQRGTDVLLRDFGGLLECARAARDAVDFELRLSAKGLITKRSVTYCSELCEIVAEYEQQEINAGRLWPFLRVLHVLNLDLDTTTRHTEAQIRSLLAYTADRDTSDLAQSSWNSLLAFASTAIPQARTLRREDLPEELRLRHTSLGMGEERILRALREHTAPILRRIRSTIGAQLYLDRGAVVQQVLDEFETAQVVIVCGPAGCGKSVIGKDVASRVGRDHFVFGFRVEEFSQPHIDATLHAAQISGNAEMLATVLSAQDRKLVLVESVERLLEKTTRDAFSDLMSYAAADPGMCLLLTCRDYSVEQVRASFLQPSGLKHSMIAVPPLDDEELSEVVGAVPALAEPLRNERLKNILRNPYFLDKALELPWPADRSLPENEREFRALFWRHAVRAEHASPLGMGRRREETLQQVALLRSRALSEYIPIGTLDPELVERLRQDSLIISPDDKPSLIATAHDVLEDWAILEWLDGLHISDSGSLKELSDAIGTHPAIRRSYRKWVAELVEREPAEADRLFEGATSESGASMQFRDDTLVSLLKAPLAPELLLRHQAGLLANNSAILKRAIQLLRVACVVTPDWLRGVSGYGSVFNVPDGGAWTTVLELVNRYLPRFTSADRPLLLGLIEDAVRGVSWWAPKLDGQEAVAGIAHALLPEFDTYRSEDARGRVFKVIAKIPTADSAKFESLLRGKIAEGEPRDRVAEEFRDLLLTGSEGMPAVRDLPNVMVSVVADYLLVSDEEIIGDRYNAYSTDVDIHFGIKGDLRHDFFPASALRGPWIQLLRLHRKVGLELYFKIFNYSIDWYAHPRLPNALEPAWEIELTFADGYVHKQWANPRLWNLYRGTSVGPYALQSMLMALERWLLAFAQRNPKQLDSLLVKILRYSQSVSLSAVVGSVAIAHPHSAGEALLVLLSCLDCIRLDRERMAGESSAKLLAGMFPELQADKKIYRNERQEANALPHRHEDLERAITNLQLGPLAPRVHAILDRHIEILPKGPERDESDLIWHLAIQRMDLRQYKVTETTEPTSEDGLSPPESGTKTYIRFEANITDPDLRAMVERNSAKFSAANSALSLWMWGIRAFKGEISAEDIAGWREKLAEARTADRESEDERGARNAPGVVAAVCVRDHWTNMTEDERVWSSDIVCSEVLRYANSWNEADRIQRYEMMADRACASVVPLLLTKIVTEPGLSKVRGALAAAITHPVQEVGWFATWGVNAEVWSFDRKIALRCVNAIAEEARLIAESWVQSRGRFGRKRGNGDLFSSAALDVRGRFWQQNGIADDVYVSTDNTNKAGSDADARVLTILSFVPGDVVSVVAFEAASRELVSAWGQDNSSRDRGRDRNFENEHAIGDRIQKFALRTTPEFALRVLRPVLDAVNQHPREIQSFVQGLTTIEDRTPNTAQYWYLWGLFAEEAKRASWVVSLGGEHSIGMEVISAVFLTAYWKEGVRNWRSLEGYAHHVHELFEALPAAWIVFDCYLRFLYHIGERSLPEAFIRLARAIRRGQPAKMLANGNSIFMLEVLLQRHVYGRPLELKKNHEIREAVLFLLDALVESGSSAAFRMRDDFVTPLA